MLTNIRDTKDMKYWPLIKRRSPKQQERKPGDSLGVRGRFKVRMQTLRSTLLQWLSIALLATLIVVPISLFVWLVFFTDVFNVQAITVVDARDDIVNEVKQIITDQVEGGPMGKNIFFVQTDSMEQAIKAKLSSVKTIHVVRKLPATIKAIVQEKEPTILLLSGGKYYFVDEEGIAYEKAMLDTLPGIVLTTVKNSDEGTDVTLGVVTIQPSLIGFLNLAEEKLPKVIGASIGEVYVPSLAAREVHVILDNNWKIYFDITRPPKTQINVLKNLLSNTVTPEELQAMEYIDLRVPNRVYYKTRLGDEV
jgi:cell division septal protein FtsQ